MEVTHYEEGNENVVKLQKKILTKKKVGFVLKGLGDYYETLNKAFMNVGAYIGISDKEVSDYITHLRLIVNKSVSDPNYIIPDKN